MFKFILPATVVVAGRGNLKCADVEPWWNCINTYANGECHKSDNCMRTCNKCDTEICYDLIPQGHLFFLEKNQAVQSEWPNQSNDGGNSYPIKQIDEDNAFPFSAGEISAWCHDVFKTHQCNAVDLTLFYDKGKSVVLRGKAYEYCRFTCGECLSTNQCFTDHNTAMQYMAADPNTRDTEGQSNFWANDFESENFGWLSNDWFLPAEEEEQETSEFMANDWTGASEEEEVDETGILPADSFSMDGFGWGSFDDWGFGRKRRSNLPKSEIIHAAIRHLVDTLDHSPKMAAKIVLDRVRRQATDQSADMKQRQQYLDEIKNCWHLFDDEFVTFAEAEEEEEEYEGEEESEENSQQSIYEETVRRRAEKDNEGMVAYVKKHASETGPSLLVQCENEPYPFKESGWTMELRYKCNLQCVGENNFGKVPFAYNSMTNTNHRLDEFKMRCDREHVKESDIKTISDCESMSHSDLDLLCDIDETAEAYSNEEYDLSEYYEFQNVLDMLDEGK